jgi:hypothetical protein
MMPLDCGITKVPISLISNSFSTLLDYHFMMRLIVSLIPLLNKKVGIIEGINQSNKKVGLPVPPSDNP